MFILFKLFQLVFILWCKMTRKTRRTDPGSPTENGNVESEDGFKWLGSGVKVNRQMHFG